MRKKQLGIGIDATMLAAKPQLLARNDLVDRRKLAKHFLGNEQGDAGISAVCGMADAIFLTIVEEYQLVSVAYRLASADMAGEDTAIGKTRCVALAHSAALL
jgi:hypothetical protein